MKIIITESQFVDLFFKRRFGRIDQLVDEKMRYYPPCDYTYDPFYAWYDYYGDVRTAVINDIINGKTDTELAALKGDKSDIERRRQEELDKTNAQLETIEKNGDSFIRVKVEVYTTLSNEETLDEVEIITFKDGSRKFRRRDGKTGEIVLDEKIKKENTTTNEQFIESWVGNLDNSLKKISEDNNPNKTAIDKINAKYNAELAALENKVKEPADTIPENPESSDDVNSPTQDPASRKEEVIDDAKRYSIDNFKADLAKVKTIEELQQVLGDLNIKVTEEAVAFEDLQVMSELAKQKAEDIKAGNVKIDPIALVEGTQLIAKEITFDDSKMFAMTGDTIVVRSVDKAGKKIVITPLGSTEEMTISFGELNEMFILKDTAMDTTEQVTTPVTKEEKDMVNQSSDLADTILNSPDQLTELEKTVSNKTIKELDSELLEDLKC